VNRRRKRSKEPVFEINAAEMPTMPACCATCFFHPENGDAAGQASVTSRTLLTATLFCHKDQIAGRPPTHICKGMRELTCQVLHGMGLIPEPTDEAFRAKSREVLG
jgi:hypothetical protein